MKFLIVLFAFVIINTGCLRKPELKAEIGDKIIPTFYFFQKNFRGLDALRNLSFSTTDNGNFEKIWVISNSDYQPLPIRLTYGVAPDGFREEVTAKKLELDKIYKISTIYGDYIFTWQFKIIKEDPSGK